MKKKRTVGSGITKRTYEAIDVENGGEESAKLLDENLTALDEAISRPGGFWALVTEEARVVSQEIISKHPSSDLVRGPQPDSEEDFARRITKYLALADNGINAVGSGHPDIERTIEQIARFAFLAGCEWKTAWMKWAWEPDALRGEKIQKAASEGGHAKKRLNPQDYSELLRVMGDYRSKGHSVARSAELAYRNHGVGQSPVANRKNWYRYS